MIAVKKLKGVEGRAPFHGEGDGDCVEGREGRDEEGGLRYLEIGRRL